MALTKSKTKTPRPLVRGGRGEGWEPLKFRGTRTPPPTGEGESYFYSRSSCRYASSCPSRSAARTWCATARNRGVSRTSRSRSRGRSPSITATTRPGRDDITTIRVDRNTASRTECVTNTAVRPVPRHNWCRCRVQAVARDLVQRAERFVHQQQLGFETQAHGRWRCAAASRPTTAREPLAELRQPDQVQDPRGAALAFVTRQAHHFQRQHHVAFDVAPRIQRRRLEHVAIGPAAARFLAASCRSPSACRRWRASDRRSAAAASSCRSPTARSATRTRPGGSPDRRRSARASRGQGSEGHPEVACLDNGLDSAGLCVRVDAAPQVPRPARSARRWSVSSTARSSTLAPAITSVLLRMLRLRYG